MGQSLQPPLALRNVPGSQSASPLVAAARRKIASGVLAPPIAAVGTPTSKKIASGVLVEAARFTARSPIARAKPASSSNKNMAMASALGWALATGAGGEGYFARAL